MTQIWPLWISLLVFPIAAIIIALSGVMIAKQAEHIARISGLGQAFVGAVFVGALTSLSGLVTSLSVAYQGFASLAASNAFGGIAAQTVFLALADLTYRKANLEHAAASETNLVQCVLLILLMCIPFFAATGPDLSFGWISPFAPLMFIVYFFGIRMVSNSFQMPMWHPKATSETTVEKSSKSKLPKKTITKKWILLFVSGIVIAISGWAIGQAGISLSAHANLEESLVGGIFTAISTSLPELIIVLAAVRQGALNLAVGNIIGGNTFDVLFIAFADFFYREGSIFAAMKSSDLFWIALNIIMVTILLLGLLRREKYGIGHIGFESFLILLIYPLGIVFTFFI